VCRYLYRKKNLRFMFPMKKSCTDFLDETHAYTRVKSFRDGCGYYMYFLANAESEIMSGD